MSLLHFTRTFFLRNAFDNLKLATFDCTSTSTLEQNNTKSILHNNTEVHTTMPPHISVRDFIRFPATSDPKEPTSTLVLTSSGNRFVDIRILKEGPEPIPQVAKDAGKTTIYTQTRALLLLTNFPKQPFFPSLTSTGPSQEHPLQARMSTEKSNLFGPTGLIPEL